MANWNPSFGVDPRKLELNHVILPAQFPRTKSSNQGVSPGLGHHLPSSMSNVSALHGTLAGLDLEMQDPDVTLSGSAHNTSQPPCDMSFPDLNIAARMFGPYLNQY